jgi:hypothetical protein
MRRAMESSWKGRQLERLAPQPHPRLLQRLVALADVVGRAAATMFVQLDFPPRLFGMT